MKKQKSILAILLSSIMIFTSCHDEDMNLSVKGNGEIRLSSMAVSCNEEPLQSVSSKSRAEEGTEETVDLTNYMVGIYRYADNTLVEEWKYSKMPEVITVPVGEYKVVAHSPEVEGAKFDEPYYYGESGKIAVEKDKVSDAGEVACRLKTIKVIIKFTDALKNILENAKVTVSVGEEKLEYTEDEVRAGYFHGTGDETTVNVAFVGDLDGENSTMTKSYVVAEGTQLTVTYSLEGSQAIDPGTGASLPKLAIKVDGTIHGGEALNGIIKPENEEILDFGPPAIEGDGFDIKQPVTDLTMKVKVNLKAPDGMAHVFVEITTNNEDFENAVKDVFKGYTEFDLAEPPTPEVAEALKSLKFPVGDEIKGKITTVEFDVTEFVGLLGDEMFQGVHDFKITVEDKYGAKAEETLVIDSSK